MQQTTKDQCSRGVKCVMSHDPEKKNVNPEKRKGFPTVQLSTTGSLGKREPDRKSSSGEENQSTCFAFMNGESTKGNACDYWHPPECSYHQEGSCKLGNKCAFKRTEQAWGKPKKRNNSVVVAEASRGSHWLASQNDLWQSARRKVTPWELPTRWTKRSKSEWSVGRATWKLRRSSLSKHWICSQESWDLYKNLFKVKGPSVRHVRIIPNCFALTFNAIKVLRKEYDQVRQGIDGWTASDGGLGLCSAAVHMSSTIFSSAFELNTLKPCLVRPAIE